MIDFILCILIVSITILHRESFVEVVENENDLQEQLDVMQMGINDILERLGDYDENMGR